MNRTDILKKCVDRGVADETEVGAVSHLFYVYLLSALQRGQRVEVPNFGTFGTRVCGVRMVRKIPYFEPDRELSDKVNERFKDLKYLVIGKYEQVPSFGEAEYKGKEAPYDAVVDQVGKEILIDTFHEVTLDEYEHAAAAKERLTPIQEEKVMPKLNLRDEEMGAEPGSLEPESSISPPPTLRDVGEGGGRTSPVLLVILILLLLGGGVFALNYFHVVHLWGKKVPKVAEVLPEPSPSASELPPEQANPLATIPEATPTPTPAPAKGITPEPVTVPAPAEKPRVSAPPSGTGNYTVQVSSWMSKRRADAEAAKLSAAGFSSFVEDAMISGENWHRVRVGRYATPKEAKDVASQLQKILEDGIWVARVGSN